MEFQKEEREWGGKVFRDTMAKNAPSLVETYIYRFKRLSKPKSTTIFFLSLKYNFLKKHTLEYIIIKLPKPKIKRKS